MYAFLKTALWFSILSKPPPHHHHLDHIIFFAFIVVGTGNIIIHTQEWGLECNCITIFFFFLVFKQFFFKFIACLINLSSLHSCTCNGLTSHLKEKGARRAECDSKVLKIDYTKLPLHNAWHVDIQPPFFCCCFVVFHKSHYTGRGGQSTHTHTQKPSSQQQWEFCAKFHFKRAFHRFFVCVCVRWLRRYYKRNFVLLSFGQNNNQRQRPLRSICSCEYNARQVIWSARASSCDCVYVYVGWLTFDPGVFWFDECEHVKVKFDYVNHVWRAIKLKFSRLSCSIEPEF